MRTIIIAIAIGLVASVSSECCTTDVSGQKHCIDCPDEHCCAADAAGYMGNPPVCCPNIPHVQNCGGNPFPGCTCTDDAKTKQSVCCPSGKACVVSPNMPGTHECCADAGMVCCSYEDETGGCCPQDNPDCCHPIKGGVQELAA